MTTPPTTSHLVFCCPHAPTCPHTATLTLEEFRELGAPHCPDHALAMVSQQDDVEVTKAVGMIMNGVTLLAAKAMSGWPFGVRKDK